MRVQGDESRLTSHRIRFRWFHRFTFSVRIKLLMVSLAVFAIPWVGYEYLREMEAFLRQGQEKALLGTARAISAVLHDRPELFQRHDDLLRSAKGGQEVFIPVLRTPIILDGSLDDWKPYLPQARYYGAENILETRGQYRPESLTFSQMLGEYDRYLYVAFIVRDDKVIYRAANSFRLDQSDHLQIALQSPDGQFYRYLLATQGPGWVNAHLMGKSDNPLPIRPEVRIKGEWRETLEGYNLELRIPMSMVGARIAFAIADVDDSETREIRTVIGTAGTRQLEELGIVTVPSPEIERILKGLDPVDGRVWVVDHNKRVLALTGSLASSLPLTDVADSPTALLMHTLYRFVLPQPNADFQDDLSGAARLEGQEIEMALTGYAGIRWRTAPDRHTTILSAAHPVRHNGQVTGAVVVEETSNLILSLQNRALENLFNVTLTVFLAATLTLIFFASRLSSRIRRLRNETEQAIGPDGRIRGHIVPALARDEVGDLSRSFATLVDRIGQYTCYLEAMASRLSHELRTPLAVVRSSIENMEMQSLSEDARIYTRRAREGLQRLSAIIARMSEASRLEQTLQRAEREEFELLDVIRGCVEGYRLAYSNKIFILETPTNGVGFYGVPELIAQMLDKLVSNAVDFSSGEAPIRILVETDRYHSHVTIIDHGIPLPAQMVGRLFESMVSIRPQRGNEPHLGMGLYIVRLIAEFHGGEVEAANLQGIEGARFTIHLPLRVSS